MNYDYEESVPFLDVKRHTYTLTDGTVIEADVATRSESSRVSVRQGTLTLLSFDHRNAHGAARTLVSLLAAKVA